MDPVIKLLMMTTGVYIALYAFAYVIAEILFYFTEKEIN